MFDDFDIELLNEEQVAFTEASCQSHGLNKSNLDRRVDSRTIDQFQKDIRSGQQNERKALENIFIPLFKEHCSHLFIGAEVLGDSTIHTGNYRDNHDARFAFKIDGKPNRVITELKVKPHFSSKGKSSQGSTDVRLNVDSVRATARKRLPMIIVFSTGHNDERILALSSDEVCYMKERIDNGLIVTHFYKDGKGYIWLDEIDPVFSGRTPIFTKTAKQQADISYRLEHEIIRIITQ